MKNFILGVVVLCSLQACNKKDQLAEFNTTWALVEMYGPTSSFTGDAMTWQEYYVLNPNRSFVKNRVYLGETKEAGGFYNYVEIGGSNYIEFEYSEDTDLRGGCKSDLTELLLIESDQRLLATWAACDGPGLAYEQR